MSQIIKRLIIFAYCLMIHAAWAGSVDKQPVDLRILVDISTSVRNSLPDSQHLDALSLLVEQLPENSRAGIWTYGKYVNYLVKQGPVSELWRKNAVAQIQRIKSVAVNRNIEAVLSKAAYDLNKPGANYRKVLLLVSSGGTLVSELQTDNRAADKKLRNGLLPKLREAGYRIHTIAINPNADNRLLQTLAKETGGFSFVLESSEDIYHISQMIKQWVVPANYLPVSQQQFAVDTEVTEFSALLFHRKQLPIALIAPNGDRLTEETQSQDISWFQGERYALVRVRQPLLGQWSIDGEAGKDSRVYLQSGIALTLNKIKDHYYVGQNVEVEAQLEGVDRDNESVRVTAELLGKDSFIETLNRSNLQTGLYSAQINGFTEPGLYHLKVLAETVSYNRVSEQIFQVNELLDMNVALQTRGDRKEYQLTISPKDEDLNLQQSSVIATVTDSQGEWKVRTISLNQDGYWELIVEDDGESTEFTVDLDFKGQSRSGREITFKPKPLVIEIDRIAQTVDAETEIPGGEAQPGKLVEEAAPSRSQDDMRADKVEAERGADSSSILLWFLAGAGALFAGAVVFYLGYRSRSKSADKDAPELTDVVVTPEAEQPEDEVADDEVAATEQADQADNEKEQYPDQKSGQPFDVEAGTGQEQIDSQQVNRAERDQDSGNSGQELKSAPDFEHDSDEIEIEIELDEVLQEETELASEWRNMDAASDDVSEPDDPEKAFEDIEIQIEPDQDNIKQEKKPDSD